MSDASGEGQGGSSPAPAQAPRPRNQLPKSYYSRFQVKYRRRRECKTDYKQRRALTYQPHFMSKVPKYRLVVRIMAKDIVCQIVQAKLTGDLTITAAYAHELPRYGIKFGLANWAAAYCTGLLVARRLLNMQKLDRPFVPTGGDAEADGPAQPQPFICILDIGLRRTTKGARIFGALKGAVDGGLQIPHKDSRFPGWSNETSELDTEVLRSYIYGGHVATYAGLLKEKDPEKYAKVFSGAIKAGLEPDGYEGMYQAAHQQIVQSPQAQPVASRPRVQRRSFRVERLTGEQRRKAAAAKWERLRERIQHWEQQLAAIQAD